MTTPVASRPLEAPMPIPNLAWWPLMLLVAISPLWSKWGGAAWVWLVVLGAWAKWKWPVTVPDSSPLVTAARWWAWSCLVAFFLRAIPQLYWDDPWGERHVDLRLMFGAMATYALVRRVQINATQWRGLIFALIFMGLAALYVTYLHGRATTSNPIAWAAAMTFGASTLLGLLFSQLTPTRALIPIFLGLIAFSIGVALSQSRGAYGLFLWLPICLIGWISHLTLHSSLSKQKGRALGLGLLFLTAFSVTILSQPRLYQAPLERVQTAVAEGMAMMQKKDPGAINTSVGARLYMWQKSVDEIISSPLWGHGKPERLALIRSWGEESNSETVKSLGHVHNEYLQAPLDHGIWGLVSRVLPLVALLSVAWIMRATQTRHAAVALASISIMAILAGLTNVNTAHNYYGAMLSLCVGLSFLSACHRPRASG